MAKTLRDDTNYLRQVREQYEDYPYPPCNPEDEKKEFHCVVSCALDRINHYHFEGKCDFGKGFRVLLAGGGTGSAVITLAEQLRDTGAEVTYLDFSAASMAIAKRRAEIRGLENIRWVHDSLLNAPQLFKEKFDLINCTGVLHHLASPKDGLAALAAVLKDDGMMDLMVYAKYGRNSVYQLQDLLRMINDGEENMQVKVDNCKAVLKHLPPTNEFIHFRRVVPDIEQFGDPGIYDLLLHSHDVAYSIPELYDFLASSGILPTQFHFGKQLVGNDLYRIESYITDGSLKNILAGLSEKDNQAAAELMHGRMIKHEFYAAKRKRPLPQLSDLENVPSYSMLLKGDVYGTIANGVKQFPEGTDIIYHINNQPVKFIKTPHAEALLAAMDGDRSLREIYDLVKASAKRKPDNRELQKEFSDIFNAFNLQDFMYLRHKSIPRSKSVWEIGVLKAKNA